LDLVEGSHLRSGKRGCARIKFGIYGSTSHSRAYDPPWERGGKKKKIFE
jgi:hypothetical protein